MLRSNNPNMMARQEQGHTDDARTFKPSLMSTQFQRAPLKENNTDHSPSFKVSKNVPEVAQTDGTMLSSRLQSIRKKYDDQRGLKGGRDDPLDSTPLKDSKRINRIPNTDYKLNTEKESTSQLQRSFSFVNKEPVQIKGPVPSQTNCTPQWRTSYGAVVSDQKAQLRKNSSFGLFEDADRYKFGGSTGSKYAQADQTRGSYIQRTESKVSEFRLNETKPRTSSEYNKRTLTETGLVNGQNAENNRSAYPEQPRIESIDKINIKIKEILKCINQNQKSNGISESSGPKNESDNRDINRGQIQQQRVTTTSTHCQTFKSYSNSNKTAQRNSTYEVHKTNYSRIPTETFEAQKNSQYNAQDQADKRTHALRMKTLEGSSISKSNIMKDDRQEGRLSSGKDLDFEIKKIQQKIKKSEQEKAKLNIRFEEMKYTNKQEVKSSSISKNMMTSGYKYQLPERKTFDKIDVPKPVVRKPITNGTNSSEVKEATSIYSKPESIPQAEPLNLRLFKVQCEIEEEPASARQSKRFIQSLREQVKLDEELRNAKIWLDNSEIPDKWGQLQLKLKSSGDERTIEQIRSDFQSSLQEHNPFYTTRDTNQTIGSLIEKYIACKDYWQNNILKRFNRKQLQEENFTEDKLDLQRKGFLTVQDFVRFLNIETGTFYRNRDLILVFRRLASDRLNFAKMLEEITNQQ